jgi:hypothetical protein
MNRTLLILASLIVGLAPIARAEIPPLSPEGLKASSTHIVTGDVRLIASEVTRDDEWVTAVGVVEIRVAEREKGDRIEPGDCVYARFSTRQWIGKGNPPPYSNEHQLPRKGDRVRAYLARKDGGYDALMPNGFEVIPRSKDAKPAK